MRLLRVIFLDQFVFKMINEWPKFVCVCMCVYVRIHAKTLLVSLEPS